MPALPGWYARIPEILAALQAAPPILDRAAFESLFQVRRRQAIRLMASTGGYQIGKTFLVDREGLIRFLERIQSQPEARHSQQRKDRILRLLQQKIVVTPPPPPAVASAVITPGVTKTAPGIVEIRYTGTEDLLTKIAALATAAAHDYPRFRETFE